MQHEETTQNTNINTIERLQLGLRTASYSSDKPSELFIMMIAPLTQYQSPDPTTQLRLHLYYLAKFGSSRIAISQWIG